MVVAIKSFTSFILNSSTTLVGKMKLYWLGLVLVLTACNRDKPLPPAAPLTPAPVPAAPATSPPPNLLNPSASVPVPVSTLDQAPIAELVESPLEKPDLLVQHQREAAALLETPSANNSVNSAPVLRAPASTTVPNFSSQTTIQQVTTDYAGQLISFQYSDQTLDLASVCQPQQQKILQYSACTKTAKRLFQVMCNQLQSPLGTSQPYLENLQGMYCQAAASFKPAIAEISISQPLEDKQQNLRQQCNDMIIKAMITPTDDNIRLRNKRCNAYHKAVQPE